MDQDQPSGFAKFVLVVLYFVIMGVVSWALHSYVGPIWGETVRGLPMWAVWLGCALLAAGGIWAIWYDRRERKRQREEARHW